MAQCRAAREVDERAYSEQLHKSGSLWRHRIDYGARAQSKSNIEFPTQDSEGLDDAEVAAMEILLAAPAPPVTNISASYYYSIPPVTIYKTYPFLSSEPFAEILEVAQQRGAEVAFDPQS